jgi:hypothetical protein
MCWKPPPHKAANTLGVSSGQCGAEKEREIENETVKVT